MKIQNLVTSFLVAAVVLAGLTALSFRRHHHAAEETPIQIEIPAQAPTVAPGSVHCIHEVCAERPRYLRCTGYSAGTPASCAIFEVDYEHHCDCDRWEP